MQVKRSITLAATGLSDMKRFLSVILSVCFVMSVVSCSSGNGSSDESSSGFGKNGSEETTAQSAVDPSFNPDFTFTTTDRNGVTYDESIFAEYELTMINMFEPWCGPCVGEMSDLEQLYQDYADQGLLIIGLYSDTSMEADLDDTLATTGVTYPILHRTSDFSQFETGYVPTTIFVDREGHVVSTNSGNDPTYVGSASYSEWATIIESLIR